MRGNGLLNYLRYAGILPEKSNDVMKAYHNIFVAR